MNYALVIELHIRFFKKEAQILTAVLEEHRFQARIDTGFMSIGLDEPYRVFISEDPIGFEGGDVNLMAYVGNNPIHFVDPTGLINFLLGVGGSLVAPTGIEGSGGIVVNPGLGDDVADIGVFGSGGAGGGINVSADVFVGYVKGGIKNVRGTTANINITVGPISLTVFTDPQTGDVMGGTIGWGPGATPVGASGSISKTGTYTVRDTINSFGSNSQCK